MFFIILALAVLAGKAVVAYMGLDDPARLFGEEAPDSWMRLVLVREWLSGAGWYDHSVPRTNAPYGGITTPWTRPLDLVIALFVKLQAFSGASLETKLLRAALALPILWFGLLLLALRRGLLRIRALPAVVPMGVALTITSSLIGNYFDVANADHHAPLTVLWALALSCLFSPRRYDGALAGGVFGLMLWISPEALVPIAAVMLVLGVIWLKDGGSLLFLRQMTTAMAFSTLLALLVERPVGQWALPVYDSLSIVHVVLCMVCALCVALLVRLPSGGLGRRMLAGSIAVAMIAGVMWLCYPLFFKGPMAEVDPYILSDFMPAISEVQSFAILHPLERASYVFQMILALLVLEGAMRKDSVIARADARQLLWLLALIGPVFFIQLRWMYYLQVLVVLVLAPCLAALYSPEKVATLEPVASVPSSWQRFLPLVRGGILGAVLLVPYTLLVLKPELPEATRKEQKRNDLCAFALRRMIQHGALERVFGPEEQTLLISTNEGGHVLFFTSYRIVAGNYHREGRGIQYVWDLQKIKTEAGFKKHLAERGITAIAYCPDAQLDKAAYIGKLYRGQRLPAWLEGIPLPPVALSPEEKTTEEQAKTAQPLLMKVR